MLPQIIYIILTFISFGITIEQHGKDKKIKKHNAWTSFMSIIISYMLLYSGGFFDCFF